MEAKWKFTRWIGSVLAAPSTAPVAEYRIERGKRGTAILRSGTLSFTGYGTTGGFVGSTSATSGMVEGDLSNARGWVEAPVATLSTRNELRDRDMRGALEAERYPIIRFDLWRVEVLLDEDTGDESVAVTLRGGLDIHGVTRVLELPAIISFDDHSIHVTSAFPLDVETFGIGSLTRLFGLFRMKREIEVTVDLHFMRLNANGPLTVE
jgi:polyisoprenoid-binding protein YceI